jgi:hypothetical protein
MKYVVKGRDSNGTPWYLSMFAPEFAHGAELDWYSYEKPMLFDTREEAESAAKRTFRGGGVRVVELATAEDQKG